MLLAIRSKNEMDELLFEEGKLWLVSLFHRVLGF